MLANDLKTYYDEVRRYLDCPKDEQDRLLLSVNKQVIELQVDNPNLDYDGIVEFLGEPESLAASLMERLSPDVVQKFKKKKRRLRLSIIACVAVVVVALSSIITKLNNKSNVIGAGDGSTSNKSISVGIYRYVSFSGNQIHNVTGSICVGVAGFIKGGGLDDLVFLSFCGAFRNGYANDRRLRGVVISAFNNLTLNCFPRIFGDPVVFRNICCIGEQRGRH